MPKFQRPEIVSEVAGLLALTGLKPSLLKLEITESVAMRDAEGAVDTLRALRRHGVKLALDDFGTGYSSLNYVRRFVVDSLKVDRTFVHELPRDPGATVIVKAITALARALRIQVTAEGIERAEQLAHVRALHGNRGQGNYFAAPVGADQIAKVLAPRHFASQLP